MSRRDSDLTSSRISSRTTAWLDAAVIVVLTRLVFLTVAYLSAGFLGELGGGPRNAGMESLAVMWNQWDAAHYVEIARDGYGERWWNTAFFPLLPLSIRPLMWLGLDPTVAGMFITTVASLIALAYLHRLADEEVGEGAGWRAATYLAFFPTAVFLVAPYGEPLFLAGAIPAFYYARRARWRAVGLPAAVAMGARLTGVALLFGLLLEGLRQTMSLRQRLEQFTALAIGGIPLVAYAAFLWRRMGHPLHFLIALRGWRRRVTDPVSTFEATWQNLRNANGSTAWAYAWGGEILAVLVAAIVVMLFLRRREWGYVAFMGATLAAYADAGYYFGTPRMLLTFFPTALLLAEATRRNRRHDVVLLVMTPLAVVGVVVFTHGVWFF